MFPSTVMYNMKCNLKLYTSLGSINVENYFSAAFHWQHTEFSYLDSSHIFTNNAFPVLNSHTYTKKVHQVGVGHLYKYSNFHVHVVVLGTLW